ncbi:HbrB-like-domain-containing protein [Lineolata rhizophorae]|uniref:HbrB-like-domain-containing protein n=1 Tax=Lineolata rhizophorae TaxID=578093 RepID=A0A6A6P8W3_9PEZI|nr:HbrB-like-domain-containing protein [Lineolata rhizophorae]
MSNLTASQIAAQAAMHVQNPQHTRKRSQTIPDPSGVGSTSGQSQQPSPALGTAPQSAQMQYQNGLLGGNRMAATTAANVAFPRSPLHSPGEQGAGSANSGTASPAPPIEREVPTITKPSKEKSKMKLFSKPKSIGISRDRDTERKHPPLPSPGRGMGMPARMAMMNASTTSLAESVGGGSGGGSGQTSSTASLYSSANASTSTLVPNEREREAANRAATFAAGTGGDKPEKDSKHKHHFLSRQKNKLKDKDDYHNLPLSSANSSSRPTDPHAPQPLYSFAAPSSPGHSSTFAKSMSGLDLRHGGRALREKKKEEKSSALASSTLVVDSTYASTLGAGGSSFGHSAGTVSHNYPAEITPEKVAQLGSTFGLPGMTPDDAWPLLKARLLNIFELEEPRPPVEDFNGLVLLYLWRCIQRRQPSVIVEDLSELLTTGFLSLDQTLRRVPDEQLVLKLVEMWLNVLSTILPFLQAVFLPLDLEFRGRGKLMTKAEAAEFWGATLPDAGDSLPHRPSTTSTNTLSSDDDIATSSPTGLIPINTKGFFPTLGDELDVRRITLLTFRDAVILPRIDTLMAIFSRLSLESLNAVEPSPSPIPTPPPPGIGLTGSAANNGNSTLAASGLNTSAGSFHSGTSAEGRISTSDEWSRHRSNSANANANVPRVAGGAAASGGRAPPMTSAQVAEMVGRLLQCVSVVASVQSGDEAQAKIERLAKELKYNWLGRGRTGRQRRGFVGARRGGGVVQLREGAQGGGGLSVGA